jgi:hypothetical protein
MVAVAEFLHGLRGTGGQGILNFLSSSLRDLFTADKTQDLEIIPRSVRISIENLCFPETNGQGWTGIFSADNVCGHT